MTMETKPSTHSQITKQNVAMALNDTENPNGMMATNGQSLYLSQQTIFGALEEILKRQGVSDKPFTIADVGAADGRTSLKLMNDIIRRIKQSDKNRSIMIYHTDLPENDFNLLFSVLQGTVDKEAGGLDRTANVFHAAIGQTMYEQNLPDESVDLIFSSVTAMNLSRRPCRIEGGISYRDASEEEKALIKQQSREDWKQFLYLRGKELRKGGYIIVLSIGLDNTGNEVENIHGGYKTLTKLLQSMLLEGVISQEEFLETNINKDTFRTEEEHSHPFDTKDEDLLNLGLELVSVRSLVNRLQHWTFNVVDKDIVAKQGYATRVVAGVKPYLYNALYNGLSEKRSEEEKHKIVDLYFKRMWDYSLENHHSGTVIPLIEVVVRKGKQGL